MTKHFTTHQLGQGLYEDAVKAYRGEIKGPRAMQTMDAVQGEFPASIMDCIRQDALKPTQPAYPEGRKTFQYPGLDQMGTPSYPMQMKTKYADPMQQSSITTPIDLRRMLLANLTGLI